MNKTILLLYLTLAACGQFHAANFNYPEDTPVSTDDLSRIRLISVPDSVTNQRNYQVSFEVEATTYPISLVQCRINSDPFTDCESPSQGVAPLGQNVFQIKVTDIKNRFVTESYSWTVNP